MRLIYRAGKVKEKSDIISWWSGPSGCHDQYKWRRSSSIIISISIIIIINSSSINSWNSITMRVAITWAPSRLLASSRSRLSRPPAMGKRMGVTQTRGTKYESEAWYFKTVKYKKRWAVTSKPLEVMNAVKQTSLKYSLQYFWLGLKRVQQAAGEKRHETLKRVFSWKASRRLHPPGDVPLLMSGFCVFIRTWISLSP